MITRLTNPINDRDYLAKRRPLLRIDIYDHTNDKDEPAFDVEFYVSDVFVGIEGGCIAHSGHPEAGGDNNLLFTLAMEHIRRNLYKFRSFFPKDDKNANKTSCDQ